MYTSDNIDTQVLELEKMAASPEIQMIEVSPARNHKIDTISVRDNTALNKVKSDLMTAFIYLIISIALATAGAIYEHFSFGVYSYFMIYAFAIPLIMGTLAFSVRYIVRTRQEGARGLLPEREMISASGEQETQYADVVVAEQIAGETGIAASAHVIRDADNISTELIWHAAVATLTVGSILTGALAICGRPNSLVIVYPIAAVILIVAAVVIVIRERKQCNYC